MYAEKRLVCAFCLLLWILSTTCNTKPNGRIMNFYHFPILHIFACVHAHSFRVVFVWQIWQNAQKKNNKSAALSIDLLLDIFHFISN